MCAKLRFTAERPKLASDVGGAQSGAGPIMKFEIEFVCRALARRRSAVCCMPANLECSSGYGRWRAWLVTVGAEFGAYHVDVGMI